MVGEGAKGDGVSNLTGAGSLGLDVASRKREMTSARLALICSSVTNWLGSGLVVPRSNSE
jgi:hypothetical protein